MKRVLITGGSRGIGRALAEKYKKEGYEVAVPSREELDLSDPKAADRYVKRHEWESFHVLINLLSPIRLIRGFLPAMKKLEFGRIVNIGSIWGVISKPGRGVYSATKHGLQGVTNTLALEAAPFHILVNTVCPGQTMTELTLKNNSPEEIGRMEREIPLGRLARPEEIADVVYFLGSEQNTYITGQQIIVDGGLTVQ